MGLNENNFFARLAIFAIKFTHIQKRNNKKKLANPPYLIVNWSGLLKLLLSEFGGLTI